MTILEQIEKEMQFIARYEKSLAFDKLKKRRADTRLKIELGGIVIKSGMSSFNKSVILGALNYALQLIEQDNSYKALLERSGDALFLNKDHKGD